MTRMSVAGVVFCMRLRLPPVPLLASSLAGLALACSGMTEPTVDPRLTVDASSYVAVPQASLSEQGIYEFTVVARFRNTGIVDVHLDRCTPNSPHPLFAVMLRSSDTRESSAYNAGWACVGHNNPIVVSPNETRVDTLAVYGPTSWDGQTQKPSGEMQGTFQLMYIGDACNASDGCRSEPFSVRLGR